MMLSRLFFVTLVSSMLLTNPLKAAEPLPIYDQWGGDFTLTDQHGLDISLSDFKNKVILLNFGYTHCPDICPNTLFLLRNTIKLLGNDAVNVQVLFITLDPERDYPERLKTFVEYFDPTFVALTGTLTQIQAVAKPYGMKFEKEYYGDKSELEYSVAHSNIIYLLDQQHRVRQLIKINAPAEYIAQDIRKLLPSSK